VSSHEEATHARFAATAARLAELQDRRAAALAARLREFVPLRGDERVLDAGTGAGALAFALAPLVQEVLGVDLVPELLEQARQRSDAQGNVTFLEGDITRLELERASFDLAATLRTLHHVGRPELAIAELTRVTRPGGTVLIVDQIAPSDPLAALELNRFESARDPTHTRALADVDFRHLFEANGLVLQRAEVQREPRDVEPYLDLAGCEGEARERARALAPPGYTADVGWYLLRRP
jgi:ubiquinone/menaquinone biosynthesis C-methylase UbiE